MKMGDETYTSYNIKQKSFFSEKKKKKKNSTNRRQSKPLLIQLINSVGSRSSHTCVNDPLRVITNLKNKKTKHKHFTREISINQIEPNSTPF